MMNIFEYQNYREILRCSLKELKATFGREFTFERMAAACRLQRPYLSSVLAGRGHLNSDQVYKACCFLKFKDEEYRYTSLLHEYERSAFADRRARIRNDIDLLRNQSLKTESHLKASVPKMSEAMNEFYLDFDAQLVHMFLTVSRFRKNVQLVKKTLNLSSSAFKNIMKKLEAAGLIEIRGDNVRVVKDNFHLPSNSFLYPAYRAQMRLRSMTRIDTRKSDSNYSFSALFSSSERSKERILAKFLQFIEWARKESQEDEAEEVFQLNFDLLKWSDTIE